MEGLSADWYVGCQDSQGNRLGGIDCLQYRTPPATQAEPAATIGFVPLLVIAVLALVIVVGVPVSAAIRTRRESVGPAPRA